MLTKEEKPKTKKVKMPKNSTKQIKMFGLSWIVANTSLIFTEYLALIQQKGIKQNINIDKYSNLSLAFSYIYVYDMFHNIIEDNAESACKWKYAKEFTDYISDDKNETLSMIKSQIDLGKPVIIRVMRESEKPQKQFITVVGIKNKINKSLPVLEEDLLILDSLDGKVKVMDKKTYSMINGKEIDDFYKGYFLKIIK